MPMNMQQTSRWEKIQGFAFDSEKAVIGFEEKLIHHTGWTRAMARQAIAEYRRFLLLACESGHPA